MLAAMIKKVYIDYEWVAKEYLGRSRERLWDCETTKETLKCFNLERNIEADLHGIARSPELTIKDLLEDSSEMKDKPQLSSNDDLKPIVTHELLLCDCMRTY